MIFRFLCLLGIVTSCLYADQYPFKKIIDGVYPSCKTHIHKLAQTTPFIYGQCAFGVSGALGGLYKTAHYFNSYKKITPSSYSSIDWFVGKNFRLDYIKLEKEVMLHRASRSASLSIFALWNAYQGIKKL